MQPIGPDGKRKLVVVESARLEGNLFYINHAQTVLEVLQKSEEVIVRRRKAEAYLGGTDLVSGGADGKRGAAVFGVGDSAERDIFKRKAVARRDAVDVDDKAYVIDVVREYALNLLDIFHGKGVAFGNKLVAAGFKLLRLVERFVKRGHSGLQAFYASRALIGVVGVHNKEPYRGGYQY